MTLETLDLVTARLAAEDAVLVRVDASQGSVPREAGAWMLVFARDVAGTVGGGHLELQAIEEARRRLAGGTGEPCCAIRWAPAWASAAAA
jgi:xanthine dehydrogenase accessory factor